MLRQVEHWDEDLRAHVQWHLEEAAKDPRHFIPLAILYLAEQTVEGLADDAFREKYVALLAESGQAATGYFMASVAKSGQRLIQELGVVEVIPPSRRPTQPGEFPGHTFPRPVIHHRTREGRKAGGSQPENIRLLLDHISFLGWHPQYLLMCARCGWPQGALATAEAYHSDVQHPCEQVTTWWRGTLRDDYDEETRELKRLVESFSEEVWGGDAIKTPAERRTLLTRRPSSGEIGKILDEALGVTPIPKWWPRKEELVESRKRRVDLLVKVLAPLRCQICAETGHLRYMPRLLLPVDADLTIESQSEFLASLATVFERARTALTVQPALGDVLWIPKAFPRQRLSELAQRFELRHEMRARKAVEHEQNWWLIAMWLADVSAASRKKTNKRKVGAVAGRRKRSGRPQWTWGRVFDELGVPTPSAERNLSTSLRHLVREITEQRRCSVPPA